MSTGTRFLLAVTAMGAAIDQATKWWATTSLRPIARTAVIPGYFELEYSLNPGAAWSFFADLPSDFRRGFFIVATIVAMGLIVQLYRKANPDNRPLRWALALLLSGAVGNLIDRVRQGVVIDFVVLRYEERFRWATFNVADVWITVGLVLLVYDMVVRREKTPAAAEEPAARGVRRRKRSGR